MKPERDREMKGEPAPAASAGPSHEVILLGKKYRLRSPHDDEYLAKLAHFVTGQVAEVQRRGAVSTMDAALLAALNIADEYFRFRNDAEQRLADVGEKTQALLTALDDMDAKVTAPAADAPADEDAAGVDADADPDAIDEVAESGSGAGAVAPRKVDAAS